MRPSAQLWRMRPLQCWGKLISWSCIARCRSGADWDVWELTGRTAGPSTTLLRSSGRDDNSKVGQVFSCGHNRKMRMRSRLSALCALLALASGASAATITGTVTNGTTHTPAAGDAVTLISLDQRMQEIAKSTTDAQGHFSIDAPDPGMHLIRIDHQGAAYFQPAPPNTPNVKATVYDVAPEVAGVTTVANVMRVETDNQGLRVTQSFFVKNDSNPPRTQFSKKAYEFYLPANATIEGSAAETPGGMPVQAAPVPLEDKGHYTFLFPLRPGVTQFQLSYHLPYSGSLPFDQKFGGPVDSFVVMMPKSMTFKAAAGAT